MRIRFNVYKQHKIIGTASGTIVKEFLQDGCSAYLVDIEPEGGDLVVEGADVCIVHPHHIIEFLPSATIEKTVNTIVDGTESILTFLLGAIHDYKKQSRE